MGLGECRKSAISKTIFIDDNIIAGNGTGVVSSVYGIFLREIGSYRQIWRYKRMGKTMEHKISDALLPPKPQKSAQQNELRLLQKYRQVKQQANLFQRFQQVQAPLLDRDKCLLVAHKSHLISAIFSIIWKGLVEVWYVSIK